jgi:hypothetical protein
MRLQRLQAFQDNGQYWPPRPTRRRSGGDDLDKRVNVPDAFAHDVAELGQMVA